MPKRSWPLLALLTVLLACAAPTSANDLSLAEAVSDWTAPVVLGVDALAWGDAFGERAADRLAPDLTRALAYSTAATWLLKVTINAPRPNGGDQGFPSGHTSMAFAFARTLSAHEPQWTVPAYAFATAVGWSRLRTDAHSLDQVLAGALVGWLAADLSLTDDPEPVAPTSIGPDGPGGTTLAQWRF